MAEKEYIEREKLKQAFAADTQSIRGWDVDLFDLLMDEIDECLPPTLSLFVTGIGITLLIWVTKSLAPNVVQRITFLKRTEQKILIITPTAVQK